MSFCCIRSYVHLCSYPYCFCSPYFPPLCSHIHIEIPVPYYEKVFNGVTVWVLHMESVATEYLCRYCVVLKLMIDVQYSALEYDVKTHRG